MGEWDEKKNGRKVESSTIPKVPKIPIELYNVYILYIL